MKVVFLTLFSLLTLIAQTQDEKISLWLCMPKEVFREKTSNGTSLQLFTKKEFVADTRLAGKQQTEDDSTYCFQVTGLVAGSLDKEYNATFIHTESVDVTDEKNGDSCGTIGFTIGFLDDLSIVFKEVNEDLEIPFGVNTEKFYSHFYLDDNDNDGFLNLKCEYSRMACMAHGGSPEGIQNYKFIGKLKSFIPQ